MLSNEQVKTFQTLYDAMTNDAEAWLKQYGEIYEEIHGTIPDIVKHYEYLEICNTEIEMYGHSGYPGDYFTFYLSIENLYNPDYLSTLKHEWISKIEQKKQEDAEQKKKDQIQREEMDKKEYNRLKKKYEGS
jgi:hypothetical protein